MTGHYDFTRYDARGWRATFYTTGMEHSITSATARGMRRSGGVGGAHQGRAGSQREALPALRGSTIGGCSKSRYRSLDFFFRC